MELNKQMMGLNNLRIIWGAMFASIFLMGYGAHLIEPLKGRESSPQAVFAFSLIGVLILFAAYYYPLRKFQKDKDKVLDTLSPMSSPKISKHELVSIYSNLFNTRNSLFEVVSLAGYMLATRQGDALYFYPFATASLIGFCLNFPTENNIKEAFFRGTSLFHSICILDTNESIVFQNASGSIKPEVEKKKFSWLLVIPSFVYFGLSLVCAVLFSSYIEFQIDNLAPFGIFLSLTIVISIFLITTRLAKASDTPKTFHFVHIGLMFLALFVGMFGLSGLICFLNQVGDPSLEKTFQVGVSIDKNQTVEEIKEHGKCYKIQHPDAVDDYIGYEEFCEKKDLGSASKKFEVTFKNGNFGMRWALKYKML